MNTTELSFVDLKKLISCRRDIIYDIEFAHRVAERWESESDFFFGEYSIPFLQDIAFNIAHESSYRAITGFYYDFVSSPLLTVQGSEIPQFHLLRGYKGQRGAHLYTYVMVCTWRRAIRYFDRKKPGSLVLGGKESYDFTKSFLTKLECTDQESFFSSQNDEIGWEILNAFFCEEVGSEEEHIMRIKKVKKAFNWLKEKDRLVLQYLVIDDKSGLEAFELLKRYLRPKSTTERIENWDDIKKQNTMSLWKTRALKHLESIVRDIKA